MCIRDRSTGVCSWRNMTDHRPTRSVGHSAAFSSAPYPGVVEGGRQTSQPSAPYRGASVEDDSGVDLEAVEASRNRPWLDIKCPNISGKRVDANDLATTLEQWGGWDEVEKAWRWRELAVSLTQSPVHPDAAARLRGFCLYHFGPEKPIYGNPKDKYWNRREREAMLHGRVPGGQPAGLGQAISYSEERKGVFYNREEHWTQLPQWPERSETEGLFRPGSSKMRGVSYGHF
eukprot:TRINITY_DN1166_c0_g1_i1.p1 TRINITY_DN1166_c0_g1~~TRINITY_DN1166_c0_g1_i1.p1  ORF type:complete len:231 (-),score=34.44 TRINITY_DN1166_c0_g1_i1:290-982(-)